MTFENWQRLYYCDSYLVLMGWCLEHLVAAQYVQVLFVILEACISAMVTSLHGASALTLLVNQNIIKGSGKYQKGQIISILARYTAYIMWNYNLSKLWLKFYHVGGSGLKHKRVKNLSESCLLRHQTILVLAKPLMPHLSI